MLARLPQMRGEPVRLGRVRRVLRAQPRDRSIRPVQQQRRPGGGGHQRRGPAVVAGAERHAGRSAGGHQRQHLAADQHAQARFAGGARTQPAQVHRGRTHQPGLDAARGEPVQPPPELVGAGARIAFDEPLGLQRAQRPRHLAVLPTEPFRDPHHAQAGAAQALLAGQLAQYLEVAPQTGRVRRGGVLGGQPGVIGHHAEKPLTGCRGRRRRPTHHHSVHSPQGGLQ